MSEAAAQGRAAGRLSTGRKAAFASGEFAFNLSWQSIELFLLFFYTDVMGLSPWWAGLIFTLGSVWDALWDPVIGSLADRTRTRWGRYRPWVLGAMPLASAALAVVFHKPNLSGAALTGYALATHLVLRTAYTTASIPYLSLSARSTPDARDRSVIAGFRMQFAAAAGLTVSLGYPWAAKRFGEAAGYGNYAIALALLALPVIAISMRAAVDPGETRGPRETNVGAAVASDFRAFGAMLRANPALLRVLAAIVVTSIALTMISKSTLYYFKYYLHAPDYARWALAIGAINLVVAAPIWAWIANRTSKRTAWLIASTIAGTGLLLLALNPSRDPRLTLLLLWLAGVGSSGYAVLFWAMLPDTVEINELRLGIRDEAKVFALALFARKMALAVNAFLLGAVLTAAGFHPNHEQSAATLAVLKGLFTLVPLAGAIGSALLMRGYRLDAAEHARVRGELSARRAIAAAAAPAELST